MIPFCLIWFNAVSIAWLADLAKRERVQAPIPPGLIASLAPALFVAVALGPLKAGALMLALWLCAQVFALCVFLLVNAWRSSNRSILPWAPDPFERACIKRVDRSFRPGLARAAVMSTLLAWAAVTISEEELRADQ